jgi:hypothetical protein
LISVDQGGHGLAILGDDDGVFAILHLVEHFAQILAEFDGADFGDHGKPPVILTILVSMIQKRKAVELHDGVVVYSSRWLPVDWEAKEDVFL